MASTSVTFTPVAIGRVAHENGTRERKAAREARAKAIFANKASIKYLGQIPLADRQLLAKGGELTINGKPASQKATQPLACILCGGVHDLKSTELSGQITFYQNVKTSEVFPLSNTCREQYFGGYASVGLVNPELYFADFPKQKARDPR